jgi:hypothetical protein
LIFPIYVFIIAFLSSLFNPSAMASYILTTNDHSLLDTLRRRFEQHVQRHPGVVWGEIDALLRQNPAYLRALHFMEETGGEPDVVGHKLANGAYWIMDCARESPVGRRSLCYDLAAWQSRKENKPSGSAEALAIEHGIEMLEEDQFRFLQSFGAVDTKTSSWLRTPASVRALGGAIFGDYRYGRVFIYHNGAESYYAARGFRGVLSVSANR